MWAWSRARSAFRGTSASTAGEGKPHFSVARTCSTLPSSQLGRSMLRPYTTSIGGPAVRLQRDLQLQHVAAFAEAKSHALHGTDIARLPFQSFDRLVRAVGGRALEAFAGGFSRLPGQFRRLPALDRPRD